MFIENLVSVFVPEEHNHLLVVAHVQVAVNEENNEWVPTFVDHVLLRGGRLPAWSICDVTSVRKLEVRIPIGEVIDVSEWC